MPTIPLQSPRRVNAWPTLCGLLFTLLGLVFALPTASAERVLVLRPAGGGEPAARDAVASALGSALEMLSYEAVLESVAMPGEAAAAPEGANEFRALGEFLRCDWVLEPRITFGEGGYRLELRVAYVPRTRLEVIAADVRAAREQARLVELLRLALRYDGVPMDLGQVDGIPTLPVDAAALEVEARLAAERDAAAAAEREAAERAEQERLAREAEAARLAEEQAQRDALLENETDHQEAEAAERWNARERYGVGDRRVAMGGLGMMGILNPPSRARGGMLAELEGRFGYSFPEVPGLELRGGLDIVFGASAGFGLTAGGVYLANPWERQKVHIGGGLELGFYEALTGNRGPQFLVRTEALVTWHATDGLWLEAALPVFTVLSANGGVMTMGMAVRAGHRF